MNIDNDLMLNAGAGYRLTDTISAAVAAQQFDQSRLVQTAGPPVERRIIASLTLKQ